MWLAADGNRIVNVRARYEAQGSAVNLEGRRWETETQDKEQGIDVQSNDEDKTEIRPIGPIGNAEDDGRGF